MGIPDGPACLSKVRDGPADLDLFHHIHPDAWDVYIRVFPKNGGENPQNGW